MVIVAFVLLFGAPAMARVAARVAQGGHNVPEAVIRRRFGAGLINFDKIYKGLVDEWVLYDNSGSGVKQRKSFAFETTLSGRSYILSKFSKPALNLRRMTFSGTVPALLDWGEKA